MSGSPSGRSTAPAARSWWPAACDRSEEKETAREPDRLRDAPPRHHVDAGGGPDRRRRAGPEPHAHRHLPPDQPAADLRVRQLRRLRPRPDRRDHRQPVRARVPVRGRRAQHRVEVYPAGRRHPDLVLPRHRHVQGDGPGGQRGQPGAVRHAPQHAPGVPRVAAPADLTYAYPLVAGRKPISLPIVKKSTASTLTVVSDIHRAMSEFKSVMPDDVDITFAFDESPTVVTAVRNVATEGL